MAHERSVINAPGAAAVGFNDLNWLKDSVDDFAHELPSLLFDDKARDGGFHKLVRSSCSRELWRPKPRWYKLLHTLNESKVVRGVSAVVRTRADIISQVVNIVFREAEELHRVHTSYLHKPNEPRLQRQLRTSYMANLLLTARN